MGYVARLKELESQTKFESANMNGRDHSGELGVDGEDNIETNLKDRGHGMDPLGSE
jgi:hypothetical protein